MQGKVKFGVVGDCHYSTHGDYATRNCSGALKLLSSVIEKFNSTELDFVLSLGDLGDGHDLSEVPAVYNEFSKSRHKVYYTVGNHDLCMRTAEEYSKEVGMQAPFYNFSVNGFRFIVLNAFERSLYLNKDQNSQDYKYYLEYEEYKAKEPYRYFQNWPGILFEKTKQELKNILDNAQNKGEEVIIFSHVPLIFSSMEVNEQNVQARMPEFRWFLKLFDNYTNIRAYIAGHYHPGGMAIRNNVVYKTVKSVCDYIEPTAVTVEIDNQKVTIKGFGAEQDFVVYKNAPKATISGFAPSGSYVMTNCGNVLKVGKCGKFCLKVPCVGKYCIKAVKEGCNDVYIPNIIAPKTDVNIKFTENKNKKLYVGKTKEPSILHIKDNLGYVRFFDVEGNLYGAIEPKEELWHEHNINYWANGLYAFSYEGKVTVRTLPNHKKLNKRGLFKGDLHAHLHHYENIYKGNMQMSAFIGKCENYDWLYMAQYHTGDDYPQDVETICRNLSDKGFLYRANDEFPKWQSNHFGNCGAGIVNEKFNYEEISSLELAKKYIYNNGGVTVPVHPFYGHMAFKQFYLWLLLAPELMPCIDFYYSDNFSKDVTENCWFKLLDMGYKFGTFATSDAAFDVGRTPYTFTKDYCRGATYVKMLALSEANLIDGIKNGRTVVTYDCAALDFTIGKNIIGDVIVPNGKAKTLTVSALWQKGKKGKLRIIKNGKDLLTKEIYFKNDQQVITVKTKITETENSYYLVILEDAENGLVRSVASPIYFRTSNFKAPEVLPMPKKIPKEILEECEKLTVEELYTLSKIDYFKNLIKSIKI